MIYKTINKNDFIDAMNKFKCGFSYEGSIALFHYLEELSFFGDRIELDPIAIRCDFTEYDDLEEFQKDYGVDEYETKEDIENNTTVIDIEGTDGFLIQNF